MNQRERFEEASAWARKVEVERDMFSAWFEQEGFDEEHRAVLWYAWLARAEMCYD